MMLKSNLFFFILILTLSLWGGDKTPVLFSVKNFAPWEGVSTRTWKKPDFSNRSYLGYSNKNFSPQTKHSKESVNFWFQIYSKYNVNQGVLHDSIHESLIYEVVDFSDIMQNKKLSRLKQETLRRERVDSLKKIIKKRLLKLSGLKSPRNLTKEERRYWELFKTIKEKDKFLIARKKNRLRFQLGQRDLVIKGIYNSGAYIEEMEDIFRKHNLPIELVRLVFVESSFNLKARSSSNATGIWQFIKPTALAYLKINPSVDERLDPLSATEAAARLLKRNFQHLDSWPLSITAYNRGLAGVKRILKKSNAKTLDELLNIRKGYFRFASANFYTSFLGILQAEEVLGKKIPWRHPIKSKKIKLPKTISIHSLLKWFDGDQKKAKEFNPHIRSSVWRDLVRIGKKNYIRIPIGKERKVLSEIKKLKSLSLYRGHLYKIRKKDTLSSIAKRFSISVGDIKNENPNLKDRFLKRGQLISIPKKKPRKKRSKKN